MLTKVIQSGNKIPKLRFSGFSGEWESKKLSDIGKTYNGLQAKNGEDFGCGEPFITYKQIFDSSEIDIKKFSLVNVNKSEKQNKAQFGDVFFTTSSETPEEVGFASVLLNKDINPYLNSFSFGFRPNSLKELYPYFVRFFFRSPVFRKEVMKLAQGSTRYNISKIEFMKMRFSFPPLGEQQKIAGFLESVDKWMESLKTQKEFLELYKKGMMQKIFSQEIRFKDENGKDFPKWEEEKLGEVAYITTGSSNREDSTAEGDYTFFDRSEDVRASSRYLFDTEAVIIAGEGQEFYPKYFVGKFDLHQRTYAIMNFKNVLGKFMFYFMHHNRKYFNKVAVGSTVPSLRLPMFNKMPVLLPIIHEQQKIAEFLTSIDKLIESKQQQIIQAEQWKRGLMQQMFV